MKLKIDFLKYKTFAFIFSILVIVVGLWFVAGFSGLKMGPLTSKGFNLGIDFQGGFHNQIKVYSGIEIEKIREYAQKAGLGSEVQSVDVAENRRIGKEKAFIIKTILSKEDETKIEDDPVLTTSNFLDARLKEFFKLIRADVGGTYDIAGEDLTRALTIYGEDQSIPGELVDSRTDTKRTVNNILKESSNVIAPKFSKGLRQQAFFLIIFVLLAMLAYISVRFKPEYALGAVLALFHDTLIMLGVIAVFQIELDLTVIAAILTVIGYSINDTIVVYDRIRENTGIMKEAHPREIFNASINQTLNRTIITSLTTFLAVIALKIWGGPRIDGFASTLLIGIVVGTYSSIFIASPVVYLWDYTLGKNRKKYKKIEQKQESEVLKANKVDEEGQAVTEGDGAEGEGDVDKTISKKQMKKLKGGKKKK